eukprot:497500-Hanusia_phi.AAC.1
MGPALLGEHFEHAAGKRLRCVHPGPGEGPSSLSSILRLDDSPPSPGLANLTAADFPGSLPLLPTKLSDLQSDPHGETNS